ncbi:MAG TPA: hypothetical protein VL547_20910 [Dinghuibacter sp.]|jgi:hypothetical protein|uniref:hypothetical protein n=1 Tax=Dinghuibacter sp. TaxID=2024697 RepID=UPI002C674EC4|nr:hypothetical protein [Dinghuibacter sp.]HTJ14518.1 hypothetical protein [Dinghuibacter sp.]
MRSIVLWCLGLALTVPAAGQNLTFAHDQHMVIVPFYTFNHHIYVKVRVNDSGELDFLFDPSQKEVVVVVDPIVAQTTNFPMTDTVLLWIKTLRIGRQHVSWTSFKDLEAREGHSFSGVLGYGFLKNFVWRFDGKHGRLIITDPGYFADNTLHGKVPLGGDLTLLLREGKTVTLNYPHNYMIVSE